MTIDKSTFFSAFVEMNVNTDSAGLIAVPCGDARLAGQRTAPHGTASDVNEP